VAIIFKTWPTSTSLIALAVLTTGIGHNMPEQSNSSPLEYRPWIPPSWMHLTAFVLVLPSRQGEIFLPLRGATLFNDFIDP
jgi:hypothetical protein